MERQNNVSLPNYSITNANAVCRLATSAAAVLSRRTLADDAQTISSSPVVVSAIDCLAPCKLVSQQAAAGSSALHYPNVISALLPANSSSLFIEPHHARCIQSQIVAMKSMQRRFGAFGKRSDDQADVGVVLADFKAADDMIERV